MYISILQINVFDINFLQYQMEEWHLLHKLSIAGWQKLCEGTKDFAEKFGLGRLMTNTILNFHFDYLNPSLILN